MNKIRIEIEGVAAEIVLGNYMPEDRTIINNWEDFYKFNDIIHQSLLLKDYISSFSIRVNGEKIEQMAQRKLRYTNAKSVVPFMHHDALYLRTECVENATFVCEFECSSDFDIDLLGATVQDYDAIFKVSSSFIETLTYDGKVLDLQWQTGKALGNICLLCSYQNGFLVPIYDAVKKLDSKNK